MPIATGAAALTLSPSAKQFRIIPMGRFKARDGRTGRADWELTPSRCAAMADEARARAQDYSIDYDHQALSAGKSTKAAGWFKDLEARPDGLYVTDARWTPLALKMVQQMEYRYISPAFNYEPTTGAVTSLVNLALTNCPALHGLTDLAATLSAQGIGVVNREAEPALSGRSLEAFVATFGAPPEIIQARQKTALATQLRRETERSDGFAGSGFTHTQCELWMNTFGKTPAELRELVP